MLSDDERKAWQELERQLIAEATEPSRSIDARAQWQGQASPGVPPRPDKSQRGESDDAITAGGDVPLTSHVSAPIVVGIDDTGSAEQAVDWASEEARARGCPLRLVHAFQPPLPADPFGAIPWIDTLTPAEAAAESVLEQALVRARSVASEIDVSARLLRGAPARALREEAAGARLLVVGSRGLCGLRGLLARSVSAHVAAHARCPVVIIRPSMGPRRNAAPTSARVVVGVDTTASCTAALGFAFQAARQRGLPLIAVNAWTPDPAADLEDVCGTPSMAEALAHRSLERALDRWRRDFADVSVVSVLVRDDPAHALLTQARGAALLVIGSRGQGRIRGTVLGSVSRSVLHHGQSPLAIIRYDSALTTRTPDGQITDPIPGGDQAPGPDQGPRRRSAPRNRRWSA